MTSFPVTLIAGIALGVIEQVLIFNYPNEGVVDGIILLIIVVALLLQRAKSGRSEDKSVWATVQAFTPLPAAYRKVRSIRALPWVVFVIALRRPKAPKAGSGRQDPLDFAATATALASTEYNTYKEYREPTSGTNWGEPFESFRNEPMICVMTPEGRTT